jgi:hypothetical protein
MSADDREAIALIQAPCPLILFPDVEIDMGRCPELRVIQGSVQETPSSSSVLESGLNADGPAG